MVNDHPLGSVLPGLSDDAAVIVFRHALAGRDGSATKSFGGMTLDMHGIQMRGSPAASCGEACREEERMDSDEASEEERERTERWKAQSERERDERERRKRAKERLAAMWPLRAVSRSWKAAVEEVRGREGGGKKGCAVASHLRHSCVCSALCCIWRPVRID